ncbi:hypothetical protein ACFFX1_55585 [Dactylosporangium sucinum]|uniref:Uncharacterized protein n=1 Tax=Dactylosporangium sucinum TaxID=1424081 RepID=A0A917U3G8_9ACTN|nr:hypothetical protein [Dactylosporangium sucinum]GGM52419.1 hypothetical protein GCM10007977_062470 [Dactylosporangium sucinum]
MTSSDMPQRLRDLHDRAGHGVVDYSLILDAADHIERLEQQAVEADEWMRENHPEYYR